VVFAEIAQRKAVEVPPVGRITKRAEIGIVRSHDYHPAARGNDAVELLHRADYIRYMLDQMDGADFAEGIVPEGQGDLVQICDHVRARVRVTVYPDSARIFVEPTTYVKDRQRCHATVQMGLLLLE
jgi:hypothetical protein